MKEFEIRSEIVNFLEKKGLMVWKDPKPASKPGKRAFKKSNGVPDILGILSDGTFFGIEVKRPGEEMSEKQKEFQQRALQRGAMCFVAYSLEDVEKRFL